MSVNLFQQQSFGIGNSANLLSSVPLMDIDTENSIFNNVSAAYCGDLMADGLSPREVGYQGPHYVRVEDENFCWFDRRIDGKDRCSENPKLNRIMSSRTCTSTGRVQVRFCIEQLIKAKTRYFVPYTGTLKIYQSSTTFPFNEPEDLGPVVASLPWENTVGGGVFEDIFLETLLRADRNYVAILSQIRGEGPTPAFARYSFYLPYCESKCEDIIDIQTKVIRDQCGAPTLLQVNVSSTGGEVPDVKIIRNGVTLNAASGSLTIPVNIGTYKIRADLRKFECWEEVVVDVDYQPSLDVYLDVQTACDGCLIVARPFGGTAPYRYDWSLNPIKLQSPMPPLPTIARIVGTSANKFRRIPCDDGATYYCLVTDSRGCLGVGSITMPKAGEGTRAYRREIPLVTVTPIRMISEIPCIWEVSVSTNPGEYPYTFEWLDSRGNVIKSEKGKTSATFITQIGGGQLRYRIRNLVGCESPVEMINLPCKYDDRRRDGDDPVHPVPGRRDDGGIDNIYGGIRIGPIGIVGSPGQIRVGGEVNPDSRIGTTGIVGAPSQFPTSRPATLDSEIPALRYTAEI